MYNWEFSRAPFAFWALGRHTLIRHHGPMEMRMPMADRFQFLHPMSCSDWAWPPSYGWDPKLGKAEHASFRVCLMRDLNADDRDMYESNL